MADEPVISDAVKQYLNGISASSSSNTQRNAPVDITPPPPGIEQYLRDGVPLDTTTGAPFMTRAGLSFAESPEDKQAYLKAAYANSTVDRTKDGNFIVRNVLDQTDGRNVDLLVNPKNFHLSDLADLTHAGLRSLAEGLAIAATGGAVPAMARLKGFTDVAVKSGIGSLTGNALDTATSVLFGGEKLDVSKHAIQALEDTGTGFAFGATLEAGAKLANFASGKLGSEFAPGPDEKVGIQSLRDLERDTGVRIQPTLGQMAADPSIGRLEAFTAKLPIFGEPLREQVEQQQSATRDLQRKVVDQLANGKPLRPLSEVGADMAEVVRDAVKSGRMDQAITSATMVSRAAQELETAIDSIAPAAKSFTTEATADLTKAAATAQNKEFRAQAGNLFEEAGNPDIPTAPLKSLLEKVRGSLAKSTVINESDLVDVHGRPLATNQGKEIIRELIPSELNRFLSGLDKLDPMMPLDQLRSVRGVVDHAITEGRGLEGVSTYQLKQVQHALTETINQGAKSLGSDGKKILRANAFYSENIERFEVPFISRLLKSSPDSPGYLRSFELMNEIRNNPDTFMDVQNFLRSGMREGGQLVGATSQPVFDALRRGLLSDILARSRVSPGGVGKTINAGAFLNELNQFRPEVRAAITGVKEEVLSKNLDLLKQIKEGFKDVPADGLEAFLRFPNNSLTDASRLATLAKREKELFENEVVKKLFNGSLTELDHMQPDQALAFLMNAKNVADVQKFMSLMAGHPEVAEQIQANAVAQLFQRVAQATKPSDAAHLTDLSQIVSAPKLIEALRDQNTRERLRSIIGNASFNIVENFAKSQAVLGKEGTGSIVGSSTATSVMTHMSKLLSNWPQTAKFILYGKVLTNRGLQRAVMDGSLTPGVDVKKFTTALIASTPIIDALSQEFGKTGTQMLMQMAGETLNATQPMALVKATQKPKPVAAPVNNKAIMDYLDRVSGTNSARARP